MAKVYAALIQKGLKTIDDVPAQLRDEVRKLLGDTDGLVPDNPPTLEESADKEVITV